MGNQLRIGTRESQLAVWQARQVQQSLEAQGISSELVYIKSGGDLDLKTPLYQMGVQGIFTKELDAALLNERIDIAVHSMKDVPTQLAVGLQQAAVLPRGPVHDLLVFKNREAQEKYLQLQQDHHIQAPLTIATSSIRRKAQWLNRYPYHHIENLRGNVNTRLRKLSEEPWDAAIFAQAGLERIQLRPETSLVLDWMLPAPSQGAIVVLCREEDKTAFNAVASLNDPDTALCTLIEKDFLRSLMGGCSTPISAYAYIQGDEIIFRGNLLSVDGKQNLSVEANMAINQSFDLGKRSAEQILRNGGQTIVEDIQNGRQ